MTDNSEKIGSIDKIDLAILDVVMVDGRISITDLAKKVGLSKSPCQVRLKRLEEQGYILGYRAVVDPVRLGLEYISFVEVKLLDTRRCALDDFNRAVMQIDEIEQCHMIAGGFDYLLKVRARNMPDYRRLLGDVISGLPHVAQTSTFVAMEAVKEFMLGSVE